MNQENQNTNTANTASEQGTSTQGTSTQGTSTQGTSAQSTTAPSAPAQAASAETAEQASAPSFDQLMAQSPKLSPLCGWIKCLRKPALSLQYSFRKQHVPDLDAQPGMQPPAEGGEGGKQSEQGKQSARGQSASGAMQTPATCRSGQNSDTMGISGACTIRYFDLALGALGLTVLGCLIKGCCCLKRKML